MKDDFWLYTRPIAHRGLWGGEILENSLTAYKNAVSNNYPIEIDLYLSTDNVLFSFHDKTLVRMTGEKGYIYDKSFSEVKSLRLKNTDEKIPTFDEILELVDGKVPLLIEIKNQPNKQVVDRVVERLSSYKGEYALQSFNPMYMLRVKKIAPKITRGILATNIAEEEKPHIRYIVKNMPFNFLIKPDFISYDYNGIPLKKSKIKNKHLISWTIPSQNVYDKIKPYVENIIFEGFIPKK